MNEDHPDALSLPITIAPPASWPVLVATIDDADLSVGEALYLAKAMLETALRGVDADLRPAVVAGFVRALRLDRPDG